MGYEPLIEDDPHKFSLSMYYAFYYKALFEGLSDETADVFEAGALDRWISILRDSGDDVFDTSTEARAILNLARNADQLVWILTILVAYLNAHLQNSEKVTLVMSVVFSIRYDPRCMLSLLSSKDYKHGMGRPLAPDIPVCVCAYYDSKMPYKKLWRPRYGLETILGQRLSEDISLLTNVAKTSGLQEVMNEHVWKKSQTPLLQANLTLILLGLMSQSLPWAVTIFSDSTELTRGMRTVSDILFIDRCLYIQHLTYSVSSFSLLPRAGMTITVSFVDEPASQYRAHSRIITDEDSLAWYGSKTYIRCLKSHNWWPSALQYSYWLMNGRDEGVKGPNRDITSTSPTATLGVGSMHNASSGFEDDHDLLQGANDQMTYDRIAARDLLWNQNFSYRLASE